MQSNKQTSLDDSSEVEIVYTEIEEYTKEKLTLKKEPLKNEDKKEIPLSQKRDDKHLKFLDLNVNDDMEQRQVEVLDGDTQTDWFIFESHAYNIHSWKFKTNPTIVSRRYSDFEWLKNELSQHFSGYILPPLPEKGIFSKIDPKIAYLNQKKQDMMDERRQHLLMFLQDLLSHRELKFAPQLSIFLTSSDQSFELAKSNSKINKDDQEQSNPGMFSNFMSFGKNMISKATGSSKEEKRVPDAHDENFKQKNEFFSQQYDNLKRIYECISFITQAKKEQAENLAAVSQICSILKEGEIPQSKLDKTVCQSGKIELEQTNLTQNQILYPLKVKFIEREQIKLIVVQQLVDQLKGYLDLLEIRNQMAQKIFQYQRDLQSMNMEQREKVTQKEYIFLSHTIYQNQEQMRSKLESDKKKMNFFLANFYQNQDYFSQYFDKRVIEITEKFNSSQASDNKSLFDIWQDYLINPN